jgi:MFS family permease
VGATAQNINQLIGASVLLGLGAAGQLSFNYALGELVPVRHRFPAGGLVFIISFPFAGLGPFIARLFIVHTSVSWRGSYYLSLAISKSSSLPVKRFMMVSRIISRDFAKRENSDPQQMLFQPFAGLSGITLQTLSTFMSDVQRCKSCEKWILAGFSFSQPAHFSSCSDCPGEAHPTHGTHPT